MSEPVITTPRLILRELTEEDWRGVHEYASDERVVYYLNWGPNSEEETRDFVHRGIACQREVPRRCYRLAIVQKDDGAFVGLGSIKITYPHYGEGGLECVVLRSCWGKGYATEAMRALQRFGFDNLKLHRMFGVVDPVNVPTARVLEKNGFIREGHLREHKWIKGIWRDSLIYAMLEDEWAALRDELAHSVPDRD